MSTAMFRPEIELFNDSLARCLRGGQFFERGLALHDGRRHIFY